MPFFGVRIRALQPLRCTLLAKGLAAVLLLCLPGRCVFAQDGKTILQNTINLYHGVSSYDGQASAMMRQSIPKGSVVSEHGFTTRLQYKKPNKLRIDFTMPQGGRSIFYNGTTLVYYQENTMTYSNAQVAVSSLRDVCALLAKLQIVSKYDTLYFLAGNSLPGNITDIVRKPDETRNGRAVYVVSAHEKAGSSVYNLTWTIDKQTNLLASVEGRTTNAPDMVKMPKRGGGVMQVRVDRTLDQNIISPRPNANIDEVKVFSFSPPQGAKKFPFTPELLAQFRKVAAAPSHPPK